VDRTERQRFVQVRQEIESSCWEFGEVVPSGDLFQGVMSQLVGIFQVRGCPLPVAEDLAQKVTGEAKPGYRRFSGDLAWVQRVFAG